MIRLRACELDRRLIRKTAPSVTLATELTRDLVIGPHSRVDSVGTVYMIYSLAATADLDLLQGKKHWSAPSDSGCF
jgi:hypothetical protein